MTAHDRQPPAYPSIDVIVAERPFIMGMLVSRGVPDRDLSDLVQIVTIAAWKSIRAGRFRPDPELPPGAALRRYLTGIIWRHATHYRDRAHVRREVLVEKPWAVAGEDSYELDAQLDAREDLRVLAELQAHHREDLLAIADFATLADFARVNGVNLNTAWSRIRAARKAFAAKLGRRR